MPLIDVSSLHDPRLADYANVKDRQLHADFCPNPDPIAPGHAEAPFGKFMAEGELVVQHLVTSRFPVISVLCTPSRYAILKPHLDRLPSVVPIYLIAPERILELIGFSLHRGVLAIAARAPELPLEAVTARDAPVVICENLTNHDNVGSVFRNSAALGGQGVLLTPGCADPLYRKSVRVSVGHALHIPFATLADFPASLSLLRARGFTIAALHPAQGDRSFTLAAFADRCRAQNTRRIALIVGTEGPGLSPAAINVADACIRIPMSDNVDSLNVSVATAVALYEFSRS